MRKLAIPAFFGVSLLPVVGWLPATANAAVRCLQFVKPAGSPIYTSSYCESKTAEVKEATVPAEESIPFRVKWVEEAENPPYETVNGTTTFYENFKARWNFGDGTTQEEHFTIKEPSEAQEKRLAGGTIEWETSHKFAKDGRYTVTVEVADEDHGAFAFVSAPIKVTVQPSLLLELIPSQLFPVINEPVTFAASQISKLGQSPFAYTFSVDGKSVESKTVEAAPPAATSFTTSFSTTGKHTVEVSAKDSTSPTPLLGKASSEVTVVPPFGGALEVMPMVPMVGEQVTVAANLGGGHPPYQLKSWLQDGQPIAGVPTGFFSGSTLTAHTTFANPGNYKLEANVADSAQPQHTATLSKEVAVVPKLEATVTPGNGARVEMKKEIVFEVSAHGGVGPYTYQWRLYPLPWLGYESTEPFISTGSTPRFSHYFNPAVEEEIPYELEVFVGDSVGHGVTLREIVHPYLPCAPVVDSGLTQVAPTGCLERLRQGVYVTKSPIRVNGLTIAPLHGSRLYVYEAGGGHDGGVEGKDAEVSLVIPPSKQPTRFQEGGELHLKLPEGKPGETKTAGEIEFSTAQQVAGLNLTGAGRLQFGIEAKTEEYFALLSVEIELPSIFKLSNGKNVPGVTGEGSIKVNDLGVKFNGFYIFVERAWVGPFEIEELCLSYVAIPGEQTKSCGSPRVGGKEYIECNTNTLRDHWAGSGVLVLPVGDNTKIGAFAGVSEGRLTDLGGFFETHPGLPLFDDVYLDRLGFGLCLRPRFRLKGEVGFGAFPLLSKETLQVNGYFQYSSATENEPWVFEIGGELYFLEEKAGEARLSFNGEGDIEAAARASVKVKKLFEVNGGVEGWIAPPHHAFQFSGYIHACLGEEENGGICAGARGEISSVGVAGCLGLKNAEIGFGYNWKEGKGSLLGGNCNFGPYEASRSSVIGLAAGAGSFDVPTATKEIGVRIAGLGAPPAVRLRSPSGQVIALPDHGVAEGNGYVAIADRLEGATVVVLSEPQAGSWSVEPVNVGEVLSSISTSRYYGKAKVVHRLAIHGRRRVLHLRLGLAPGQTVELVEHGKHVEQTLVNWTQGRPCGRWRCIAVKFRPAFGTATERTLELVVGHGETPFEVRRIARFRVPKPAVPPRPKVELLRDRGRVVVRFSHSPVAARYVVAMRASNGKTRSLKVAAGCKAVVVGGLPKKAMVTVQVYGVRRDGVFGKPGQRRLRRGQRRVGAKLRGGGRLCRG